jgi:mycothiol synthase
MEINLAAEPPPPVWPEGISVRIFQPGEERAVYDVDMEAFQDHWDFFPVPFDDWREYFVGRSDFDPELWFLAMDGDEIAGTALCAGESRPNIGRVNVLAVRRPWRRRGLGKALLLHAFHELRRRGRPKADLNVDGENLTGAVRLYEHAGMHVARRDDSYRKELS